MKPFFKLDLKLKIAAVTLLLGFTQGLHSQSGLTLNSAMQIAESNSPSIRKTMLSLVRSQENLNAQRASLKSAFSLTVNPFSYTKAREFNDFFSTYYTRETKESSASFNIVQPIVATDATVMLRNNFNWKDSYSEYNNTSTTGFSNNLFLSIDQPIFTYNRTKLVLKQLEMTLENAQLSYAIQRLSLERQVAQAFYAVYQQQQSLDIADRAYKNMQGNYDIIRNKVEAGVSAEAELFQAELNLASTKSDYENRLVSLENTKDDFKLLIGLSLYDDVVVMPDISVDTIQIDVAFAIEEGLENRLELRQREISLQNSEFDMITTMALNEFKGSVGLSLGIFGDNSNLADIYSNPTDNQSVSLSLQVPLWDWGEKKSRIKAAEASIETQKISYEEEENNIILGIRKVYRNLLNLKNQIEIARQSVTNAQLTYELNLEKYKNGDLTGMDLNIYQNQLSEKEISYTNSLISYKLELLNLKIQTLYDFEKGEAVAALSVLNEVEK
ncbi:MAG: TolC family protein [Bacteroidales bacterium]|nr:TolC family protein [Bacteroidales bacterium]